MASVLSRIQIIMEANTANYNNELRRARQHSNSAFGKIAKSAGKMALGVGTALAGIGALSVKTAMSFETAMAEVNKTADFVTEDGLGNLRKELEDLSKTMPLAFEELADIAASGGQMGIAGENLASFTETIAKMGIAFDISAGQAAESMGFIASAYQVPIEKLSEVGDAINEVSNNSGATADKTIDFMLRTGAAANNMNIAAEATAAMGAAIIDAGGSVEKSGTAVSNMLLEMANPEWLKDNADMFKKMGVSTTEFAELVKTDGLAAFNMFRDGVIAADDPMSNLREAFGASAPHIQKLFDETSKFVPLMGAVGQGAEGAATHIGSLDNEYQIMADTTANAFVRIKNNAMLVAATLGDAFLPAVLEVTDALIPMVQNVAAWAKENPELIVQIAKVTGVVLGAIIAVAAISSAVGTAITTFAALKTVFLIVKGAAVVLGSALGAPILIIGALVAAGVALYMNWDLVKKKASELGAWIGRVWNKIKWDILQAVTGAKDSAIAKFNELKTAAVNKLNQTADGIVNALKGLPSKMLTIGKQIVDGLVNGIKNGASNVANAIGNVASGMVNKAKSVLGIASPSKVTTKIGLQTAEGMAVGIKKGTKQVVTEAQRMAEQAIKAVEDGIAGFQKRIALFGDSSELSSLLYDINAGNFKGASKARIDEYVKQAKALEQLEAQLKATNALQARFDKLQAEGAAQRKAISAEILKRAKDFQTEQASALDAFGGLDINQPQTEADKLRAAYENKMAIVNQFEDMHTEKSAQAHAARVKLTENYNQSIQNLEMQKQAQTVGSIAAMFGMALGETSKGYQAMFLVQKAYDFVAAQSASFAAIAKAWSSAPFPANIPAVATTTLQTGIIPAAIQALAPKGFKSGGYTGSGGVNDVAGMVHGREFVAHAEATRKYRPELEAMNDGSYGKSASNVSVSVTVNSDGTGDVESSAKMGREMGHAIKAVVLDTIRKEKRQGGVLYA